MPLNEADTRAQFIDPKINRAGWTRSQVTREHFYKTDWQYTDGKIILRCNKAERERAKRVDYLLSHTDGFAIAAIEAKAESRPATEGLQQVKEYARDLSLAFTDAANGRGIIEMRDGALRHASLIHLTIVIRQTDPQTPWAGRRNSSR